LSEYVNSNVITYLEGVSGRSRLPPNGSVRNYRQHGMSLSDITKYLFIRQLQEGKTPVHSIQKDNIIQYNGHTIHVRETLDNLIFISADKHPCFIMELDTATLTSLEGSFIDIHESTKDLVRVAVMIARKHGIHEIVFTDNSTIQCPQKVHLSDLSFLTTGKTWYESILPLEYMSDSRIDQFRHRVMTNTWDDVFNRIRILGFTCPFDTTGIDTSTPGSAMAVLDRAKKSRSFCKYFSQYMGLLLISSHITSLHGDTWSHKLRTT